MKTNYIRVLSEFHRISSSLWLHISENKPSHTLVTDASFTSTAAATEAAATTLSPLPADRRQAWSRTCSWWCPWLRSSSQPPSEPACCGRWPAPGSGSRRRTSPCCWTGGGRGGKSGRWEVEGEELAHISLGQICGPSWNGESCRVPKIQISTDSILDYHKKIIIQKYDNKYWRKNKLKKWKCCSTSRLCCCKNLPHMKWNQFF